MLFHVSLSIAAPLNKHSAHSPNPNLTANSQLTTLSDRSLPIESHESELGCSQFIGACLRAAESGLPIASASTSLSARCRFSRHYVNISSVVRTQVNTSLSNSLVQFRRLATWCPKRHDRQCISTRRSPAAAQGLPHREERGCIRRCSSLAYLQLADMTLLPHLPHATPQGAAVFLNKSCTPCCHPKLQI